ncbi:methyltransferase family protein [Patescibacteria group bacterium]
MKNFLKMILGMIFYTALLMWLFFIIPGNWSWLPGWIFIILFLGMIVCSVIPLLKNKKLMAERRKLPFQKGQNITDKILISLVFIFFLGWLVIMPLDSQKFEWTSTFPVWLVILGIIGYIIGDVLMYLVFKQNTFLIPVVKKQEGQKVVTTGVYSIIRHPMYFSIVLILFGGALLLSSLIGIYVSIAMTVVFYIRAITEEKLMLKELDGYEEYKKKVKYRIVPFLF